VLYRTNGSQASFSSGPLAAGQTETIVFTSSAVTFVNVTADYLGQVNESIESDNSFTTYI
jgi:hypothetical protein